MTAIPENEKCFLNLQDRVLGAKFIQPSERNPLTTIGIELQVMADYSINMSSKSQLWGEVITEFSKLEALAGDWHRLWKAHPRRNVFNTFAWALASWRAYGSRLSLYTPVVYQGDKVVGILPLVVEGRTLRFLGSPHSDYNDMLCEEGDTACVLETALRALFQKPIPWDRCVLENVSEHSSIVMRFDKLSGRLRSRLHLSFSGNCPSVVFVSGEEDTLQAILKKKSLLRHEKALRRLGEVSFRHLDNREEIRSYLPGLFRQHIARRALAGDRSIFCDEEACSFYRALVDELDPQKELRFSVLELDKRPVAYHFGFEVNGTFFWYKPTFDVDLCDYSPGEVLIKKLFEYVGSHKLQEFDFTVGGETFKDRFSNRVSRNYRLYLFPSGPIAMAGKLFHRTKDHLKKYPKVRHVFSVFRAFRKLAGSRPLSLRSME